jgi:hypothetical protein
MRTRQRNPLRAAWMHESDDSPGNLLDDVAHELGALGEVSLATGDLGLGIARGELVVSLVEPVGKTYNRAVEITSISPVFLPFLRCRGFGPCKSPSSPSRGIEEQHFEIVGGGTYRTSRLPLLRMC